MLPRHTLPDILASLFAAMLADATIFSIFQRHARFSPLPSVSPRYAVADADADADYSATKRHTLAFAIMLLMLPR